MTSALSVVLSLALGATVSQSRFGVIATGSGAGVTSVLAGCPRAVEASATLGSTTAEAVLASYRSQCTGGVEILELPAISTALPLFGALDLTGGQTDADQYWGSASSAFTGVTTTSLRWVAGPANLFSKVDPNAVGTADYVKGFVAELATKVKQRAATDVASYALIVSPWSTTTPGGFCDVVAAARAADAGIAWSWRATTTLPATVTDEATTTFGYRTVRTTCALQGVPIFADVTADWFSGGRTAAQVVEWLNRVDQAVVADADVVTGGALLLRSFGGGGADDLSAAATEIATYLQTPLQGGSAGGGGGGGTSHQPPGGTDAGTLVAPRTGCGNSAGAASLLALAPLALRLRRRR